MKLKPTDLGLSVIARSPFHVYYEGVAVRVSGANQVGPFDVLPGHADFFSIMTPCDVTIDAGDKSDPVSFPLTNGIITVRDNVVMLFANM